MNKYLMGALLLTSMPVWAVLPHGATPAEVAMCEAYGMPGGGGRYQGHYCDALRFTNRAYSSMRNKSDMKYYLEVAIDNFNYVLNRPNEFGGRIGDAHVGKARALKMLGRKAEAAAEFNKALNYRLNSPDVYQALADQYYETGNKEKALEKAIEGLKRNPNSKGLKRRYIEFGGKLPYPDAVAESMSEESDKGANKPEAVPKSAVAAGQASEPNKQTVTTEQEQPPEYVPPKIGTPSNPYCRFCVE